MLLLDLSWVSGFMKVLGGGDEHPEPCCMARKASMRSVVF